MTDCKPFIWYEDDTGDTYTNEAVSEGAAPEGLRPLYDRPQPDDTALLRQALEVLSRAHQAAMVQTLKARIPECAEFGGIAQDLDFVVAALRERLRREAAKESKR